ncbi:LysR family transcriptional regulator [Enterovibrio paralichthyis]|uniref:LysR family transcriptional regulator n=1 Tax=Enterovibrio paralichthyis TaxID=2853805 RepID=UPI001C490D28|nr:LysR family transcriptional regulator [Enterovibrio paralichthyis]MBV7297155.1 LysR family transcriptional regulator [Enterovibrio paralichthyis]
MSTNNPLLGESLNDIRSFVAIAETGSFSKAAEKLNASRAHVSRQLSQLEARLGVQLIIRTTRSQRLTSAGEDFFVRCRAALSQLDEAIFLASHDADAMRGHISVNCVGGIIGESLIGDAIHDFCVQHPEISIELDFSSERVDLIQSRFDLVLRMGALADSNLIGRELGEIRIGTYAAPSYFARKGKPENPKALHQHNCLTGSVAKWRYVSTQEPSQHCDVEVGGSLQCKNGHVMLSSALKGNGICRLPALYCERYVETGELEPVFTDWRVDKVPLYLLYHRDRHQPARLKALIRYLVETIPQALRNGLQ